MKIEDVIKNMEDIDPEDLLFCKRMIKFFKMIGLDENGLSNLVQFALSKDELFEKINAIIEDQKYLNSEYQKAHNPQEEKTKNPLEEFNRERERLNIHG